MTRTQIYLTDEQRRALALEAKREGVSLAEIIRRAVNRYMGERKKGDDFNRLLDETLGVLPDLRAPSRKEWDRGYG